MQSRPCSKAHEQIKTEPADAAALDIRHTRLGNATTLAASLWGNFDRASHCDSPIINVERISISASLSESSALMVPGRGIAVNVRFGHQAEAQHCTPIPNS
jgi:hypothetical protein